MSNVLGKFKKFFSGEINPLAGYTLHSGGARGSDNAWATLGEYHKINPKYNIKHYCIGNSRTPHSNTSIKLAKAKQADPDLIEVNKILGRRFPTNNKYTDNLLRRNWIITQKSEAIYGIAEIDLGNNIVQGGTAWATHLAILQDKPVYIYSQMVDSWFIYKDNQFIKYDDIPVLTKNFGGIGMRDVKSNGIEAINSVYKHTIQKSERI